MDLFENEENFEETSFDEKQNDMTVSEDIEESQEIIVPETKVPLNVTIKQKIDSINSITIDFTNYEEVYRDVLAINTTLRHNIDSELKQLQKLNQDEKHIKQSMLNVGINRNSPSSDAWKPLALNRAQKNTCLENIKENMVLINYLNSIVMKKFKRVIELEKGMILAKELSGQIVKMMDNSYDRMNKFFDTISNRFGREVEKNSEIFKSSLGFIVGGLKDKNSEEIEMKKTELKLLQTLVSDKEKKIDSLIDEIRNLKTKEGPKNDMIEDLQLELVNLKGDVAFITGFLKKNGVSEKDLERKEIIVEEKKEVEQTEQIQPKQSDTEQGQEKIDTSFIVSQGPGKLFCQKCNIGFGVAGKRLHLKNAHGIEVV